MMIRFLLPLFVILNFKAFAQHQDKDMFNADTINYLVNIVAADSMMGRYSGSEGAGKAAKFIAREFNKADLTGLLKTIHQTSQVSFKTIKLDLTGLL